MEVVRMQMTSEVKVGLVTLAGLVLLAVMTFFIGDINPFESWYFITATFHHVDGLLEGSKVTFAGVKVGKVERIEIKGNTVHVHMRISSRTVIPGNAIFTIDTAGLMGEKYVGIEAGPDSEGVISAGAVIKGVDPVRLTKLFSDGSEILEKVRTSVENINELLGDKSIMESAKQTVFNVEEITEDGKQLLLVMKEKIEDLSFDLSAFVQNLNGMLEDNRDTISNLMANLDNFAGQLVELARENRNNINDLLASLSSGARAIDKMVSDIEARGRTAREIRQIISNLDRTAVNVEKATRSFSELMTDGELKKDIKGAVKEVGSVAKKADKFLSTFADTKMDFDYTLRYDTEEKLVHSDLYLTVIPGALASCVNGKKAPETKFIAGIKDLGERNLLDLTLGRQLSGRFGGRAGLISGKVGIGVDYRYSDRISYSVDLIDPQDPYVDYTSNYNLWKNIMWRSRMEDVFGEKKYNVGVCYKF